MLIVTDTNSPWYNTYGVVLVWCMVLILLIKDLTLNSQVFYSGFDNLILLSIGPVLKKLSIFKISLLLIQC